MEHSCHKCNQPVEDGIPFCSHCGAPQIRVAIPEPVLERAPAGDEALPAPQPLILQGSQGAALISVPMRWSQTLRPCALAALIAIGLTSLGLYPLVAIFGAGALAVPLYRRGSTAVMKAAAGARLGALTGLICFAMSVILMSVAALVSHKGPEVRSTLLDLIKQAAAKTNDPQTLAMFDYFRTPSGLVVMMLMALVLTFFVMIVLASLGGALSGAFLGRRDRR